MPKRRMTGLEGQVHKALRVPIGKRTRAAGKRNIGIHAISAKRLARKPGGPTKRTARKSGERMFADFSRSGSRSSHAALRIPKVIPYRGLP